MHVGQWLPVGKVATSKFCRFARESATRERRNNKKVTGRGAPELEPARAIRACARAFFARCRGKKSWPSAKASFPSLDFVQCIVPRASRGRAHDIVFIPARSRVPPPTRLACDFTFPRARVVCVRSERARHAEKPPLFVLIAGRRVVCTGAKNGRLDWRSIGADLQLLHDGREFLDMVVISFASDLLMSFWRGFLSVRGES